MHSCKLIYIKNKTFKIDKARKAAQPTLLPGSTETLLELPFSDTCAKELAIVTKRGIFEVANCLMFPATTVILFILEGYLNTTDFNRPELCKRFCG